MATDYEEQEFPFFDLDWEEEEPKQRKINALREEGWELTGDPHRDMIDKHGAFLKFKRKIK